jgi:hypothetical protein
MKNCDSLKSSRHILHHYSEKACTEWAVSVMNMISGFKINKKNDIAGVFKHISHVLSDEQKLQTGL